MVMGLLIGYYAFAGGASQHWRLFLTTGILGGYTTFSAFSLRQRAALPARRDRPRCALCSAVGRALDRRPVRGTDAGAAIHLNDTSGRDNAMMTDITALVWSAVTDVADADDHRVALRTQWTRARRPRARPWVTAMICRRRPPLPGRADRAAKNMLVESGAADGADRGGALCRQDQHPGCSSAPTSSSGRGWSIGRSISPARGCARSCGWSDVIGSRHDRDGDDVGHPIGIMPSLSSNRMSRSRSGLGVVSSLGP